MYKLLNLQILKQNGYHMIIGDRRLFDYFAKIIFGYFFSLAFETFNTYFTCSPLLYLIIYPPSCSLFDNLTKYFCFFCGFSRNLSNSHNVTCVCWKEMLPNFSFFLGR